jgi:hypothetical protein
VQIIQSVKTFAMSAAGDDNGGANNDGHKYQHPQSPLDVGSFFNVLTGTSPGNSQSWFSFRSLRLNVAGVSRLLFEHRAAGFAEIGLLPPQAGSDRPDVRDFACAQTVDIRRAGPFLFRRRNVRACGTGSEHGERQRKIGAGRQRPTSFESCLHDSILSHGWRRGGTVVMGNTAKIVCEM